MEAASRPKLEPLADLPVEEPMGPTVSSGSAKRSSLDSGSLDSGSLYSGDDLLSHGALLDLSASPTVAAPVPEARPDTALIPTLTASTAGELLDPEVLLGVSEAGGAARMDGPNGAGTL